MQLYEIQNYKYTNTKLKYTILHIHKYAHIQVNENTKKSNIRAYTDTHTQIYKYKDQHIYKYTNIQLYKGTDTKTKNKRIYEYTNARIYKYTIIQNIQILIYSRKHLYTIRNKHIHKFTNTQMYKYTTTKGSTSIHINTNTNHTQIHTQT